MRTYPVFHVGKLLAFIIFSLISFRSFSQNKSSVKGVVLDSISKIPVELATVALVNAKDTSLISYTVTQKDGAFLLTGLPSGVNTKLIISTMGYSTYRNILTFKPGETKEMKVIYLNYKSLNEVIIKGEITPVIQKKDTLEFNAEAFKTRPNAVVEDLLRLLPGVQVNVDGSILVNGTQVNKVLIDGKRFFGTDLTVATKNLDAELVSKVQVYDDREEDPDHKLAALQVGKIINLKLKNKIRKSTIGKVYAGVGTQGRYEGGGIISTFRDTLQVTAIGIANNLTKTGFSSSELYSLGGFNRSGGSQQNDGTFGGNGDGGIEKVWSGGFNINNDYGPKLKTNLMYFYSDYVKDYDKKLLNQQNLDQTTLNTLSKSVSEIRQQRHTTSSLIEWVPDTIQRIRFDARLDIMPNGFDANGLTNTTDLTNKISDLFNKTAQNGLADEFTDNFIYYRRLRKQGSSLTIKQSFYLNKSNIDEYDYNQLTSYTTAISSSLLDRYTNIQKNFYKAGLNATLNTPFNNKTSNELFVQSRYVSSSNGLSTYDNNAGGGYTIFLDDQSNNITRNIFIQNAQNTINYNVSPKTMLKAGFNLEIQQISNNFNSVLPNNSRWYTFLFPTLRLSNPRYTIEYGETAIQPDIYQMQPITRQISQVETLIGNPDLTPSHKRNLSANYFRYNMDRQSSFRANGTVSLTENNVVQVSTRDTSGFTTSGFTNKGNSWSSDIAIFRGQQFKKTLPWQIGILNGFNGHFDQRTFFFNGSKGTQYNYYISIGQNLSVNYKSFVEFNTTYKLNDFITNYNGVNYAAVNTLQHQVISVATIYWPQNFIFDAQYQYTYNPQIAPGFSRSSNVVNLALTMLMFKQNRGQVKLSVYDLFNQNINTYRYASNNAITTGEQQILRRYFFINYQYKINTHR